MKTVAVLMSTYNGEKYLREQIESVLKQEGVFVRLIVRDDGSSDKTTNILSDYERENKLVWYTGENLKPLGSFMNLLFTCDKFDYYAFCDQDDVWSSKKLWKSLSIMENDENNNPNRAIIVHTDMSVVDEDLNIIHRSFWDVNGIRPDILNNFIDLSCYNGVNGCTILMNNIARDVIQHHYFEQMQIIHDVFCALTVSANNGVIDYLDEPTVLYRQHSENLVGADHINKLRYLSRFLILNRVIANNYRNYLTAKRIGDINMLQYIIHKIRYIFTKKHGLR